MQYRRNARLGSASFLTIRELKMNESTSLSRNARLGSASFLTKFMAFTRDRTRLRRNARLGSASFLTVVIDDFKAHTSSVVMPVWAVPLF